MLVNSFGFNAAGWLESTTDPRALVGKQFYDLARRTTKAIENYVDGTVSDTDDKTVEFTSNGLGANKTVKADLTGGGYQTTENVYGISTSGGLVSNDIVGEVRYPDPSSGNSSSSEKDVYTYDQLGEVLTKTDRNGNVHTYSRDVVGRITSDAITTLGTNVDGAVRRIEYAYDTAGNLYLVTSYDAASGGSVVDQVQRAFNGLGQLTQEWQATNGTVNTSTSPSVQYAYSFTTSGSMNHSRLTSITYPNGRAITYNYASGLADTISRLSSISDGATTLESYSYLGLGTVVKRAQGSGVALDYTRPGTLGLSDGGTAASSGGGFFGNIAWSNPSNALTSNNSRATAALNHNGANTNTSEYLVVSNFGFTVPMGATIVGFTVKIERRESGKSAEDVRDNTVQLRTGSGGVGSNKADTSTNWPTADTIATYGGTSDTWSAGLTPSDVNSSDFGVRVRVAGSGATGSVTAEVDDVQISITYTADGGDQYTGLDRFGRVIDQAWVDSSGNALDRRQYGYDRDSNRLYSDNLVSKSNSELYTYDGLNQLSTFQRGTLNNTKTGLTGSASRSQSWDFDALGNFDSQTTDGTAQTRNHNKQNEITSVSSATTPTYDSSGDMTGDETGKQFVYDAWGRLIVVKDSGGSTLATYRYDGLNRRVRETVSGTTTDLYYSSAWQVLEEDVSGTAKASYVWSPVYVDALIARDRDADGNSGNGLEERLYAMQDANFNVTGLLSTSGTAQERYLYDPYGSVTYLTGTWGSRSSSSYNWIVNFQGLRADAVANGINDRNREEVPTLGREGRLDPLGFRGGDQNLYRVVGNSPVVRNDPLGLAWGDAEWENRNIWGPAAELLGGPSITGPINPSSNAGAVSGIVFGGLTGAFCGLLVGGIPGAIVGGTVGAVKGGVDGSAAGSAAPTGTIREGASAGTIMGIRAGVYGGWFAMFTCGPFKLIGLIKRTRVKPLPPIKRGPNGGPPPNGGNVPPPKVGDTKIGGPRAPDTKVDLPPPRAGDTQIGGPTKIGP